MSTIDATQIITAVPGVRGGTRSRPAAVSSQAGLASIRRVDPMYEATARAAAKAGMTVEAWIAHTDRLEKDERRFRSIDRTMRRTPTYKDWVEDAA